MIGNERPWLASWIFLGLLAAAALVMGILQYRWIGAVSLAERDRLAASLQAGVNRIAQEFNARLATAVSTLAIPAGIETTTEREREYAARYVRLRETQNGSVIRRVFIARPSENSMLLLKLDPEKSIFAPMPWPGEWESVRDRALAKYQGDPRGGRGLIVDDQESLLESPYFGDGPDGRHELEWLLVEVDLDYIRSTLVPEIARRNLGDAALDAYALQIAMRGDPAKIIYRSDPAHPFTAVSTDATASLFDYFGDRFGGGPRREPPGGNFGRRDRSRFEGRGFGGGPPRQGGPGFGGPPRDGGGPRGPGGRWQLSARYRAGSLETVVARTRTQNLVISTAMLILILIAGSALVSYTRRARKLADMQVEFVAGVSHELRTPLTVMRTAGYNLQSAVAKDPERVRRYGSLVQSESEKLTAIVEQILGFANAKAGRVISERSAVEVEPLIEEAIAADRAILDQSGCELECRVDSDLPPILGDRVALGRALQNLISNAAKYGKDGGWIGISAALRANGKGEQIEIRVADRGKGVDAAEAAHIFDPFYRGKSAVADQIHGTGLGLALVKRIIDAHEGAITLKSAEGQGAEFVLRLPVVPQSQS